MAPLGAPSNPGGVGTLPAPTGPQPITGNTFAAGAAGPAVTPALSQGLQGSFGLQYFDVTLTSAQILLLQTTPVTLIPAPGVGFMIKPTSIKMIFTGGSVAYTDAGGAVSFTVGANIAVALASNAIFLVTVTPNRRTQLLQFDATAVGAGITGVAANPPTEDNAPLNISKITNQFAAGNGTMKITIYYTIEPTT